MVRLSRYRLSYTSWLLIIFLLAFALRVARLDFQPLWWDEGWTVYFATSDLATMIARTAIDIHPPFYYLLLKGWIMVAGPTPFALRSFSLFIGLLTIPLAFLVGRRLFNLTVGALTALLLALAPFHIYYSQEARMYALVTFLGLLSTYLALRLWTEGASFALWSGYILATVAALYTQYYGAFIPLAQTLFLLSLLGRFRRVVGQWLAAQLCLFLLYLPWLLFAGGKLVAYVGTKLIKESDQPLGLASYLAQQLAAMSLGHLDQRLAPLAWSSLLPLSLAALGVAYVLSKGDKEGRSSLGAIPSVTFALFYLFVPLLLGFLINLRYPFRAPRIERLLLLAAPALYMLLALGFSALWRRKPLFYGSLLALFAISAVSLYGFYTIERFPQDDYRPLMASLEALAGPQDVVVAVHPWQVGYLRSYLRGPSPSIYLTPKEETDVTEEEWAEHPESMKQGLDGLLATHARLWFPAHQTLGRILENEMEEYLTGRYTPFFNQWYGQSTKLLAYAGEGPLATIEEPLDFGGEVILERYGLSEGPVESAWGVVRVDLLWRMVAEGRYRVVTRLLDEKGQEWARRDSPPLAGLQIPSSPDHPWRDGHGLLVPAGTPPGRYQVRLFLYHEGEERALEVAPLGQPSRGVEAILGWVEVVAPTERLPLSVLPIQHLLRANFEGKVELLGYSLSQGPYRSGEEVKATLFWRALSSLGEDYGVAFRLKDRQGKVWTVKEATLQGLYPTSRWPVGGLFGDPHSILIPADLPEGEYGLSLSLFRPDDGVTLKVGRWPFWRGQEVTLATLTVEGRPHITQPPASIQHRLQARLGDGVLFLGYDLDATEVIPGGSLRLVLYWQALARMDTSYTVFTHLINEEGMIWGQKDNVPGEWTLPTTSWVEGEYITDRYEIPVKEDGPPGRYWVEIGMYNASTGARLPVYDEEGKALGDRLLLEETPIRVVP